MSLHPRHTPESLLDAAETLFSERGYAAVGIRQIADAAGANLASIRYHFGSKRELYLQTVRRVMARRTHDGAWAALGEAPGGREAAAAALAHFIRSYLESLLSQEEHRSCGALLLWEAVRPSEAIDDVVREYVEPGHRALVAVVRRLLPPDERDTAPLHARSVLGQILHYRVFRPFIDRMPDRPGEGLDAAGTAAHVIRASLRAMRCPEALIDGAIAGPCIAPATRVRGSSRSAADLRPIPRNPAP